MEATSEPSFIQTRGGTIFNFFIYTMIWITFWRAVGAVNFIHDVTIDTLVLYLVCVGVSMLLSLSIMRKMRFEIDKKAARMGNFFASFTHIETLILDSFKVGLCKALMRIIHV